VKLIKALMLVATLAVTTSAFAMTTDESMAYTEALTTGDVALVKKMLDDGTVTINEKREFFGWTALQIAANKGQLAVVQELLKHHPNVDYQHEMTKNTALHLAAMNGYKDIVKTLVAAGADVNLKMKGNVSILRVVSDMKNTEMVDLLVSLGAKDDGCQGECF
jgi:ankyrin repeat protein